MTIIQSFLLGLIQGLTEFLPVSSSAHLIILPRFFNLPHPTVSFAVLLHLATALSVVIFFWRDFWEVLASFFTSLGQKIRGRSWRQIFESNPQALLAWALLWATLPTAAIGYGLKDFFEKNIFNSPAVVGALLIVTGFILFWGSREEKTTSAGQKPSATAPEQNPANTISDSENINPVADTPSKPSVQYSFSQNKLSNISLKEKVGFFDAFLIGLAQGIAVAPGISRSGITVVAALKRRLTRPLAIKFSFLLALPAILGAGLVEAKDIFTASTSGGQSFLSSAIGFMTAFLCGLWAIKFFVGLIRTNRFRFFAYYCWLAGLITIFISL